MAQIPAHCRTPAASPVTASQISSSLLSSNTSIDHNQSKEKSSHSIVSFRSDSDRLDPCPEILQPQPSKTRALGFLSRKSSKFSLDSTAKSETPSTKVHRWDAGLDQKGSLTHPGDVGKQESWSKSTPSDVASPVRRLVRKLSGLSMRTSSEMVSETERPTPVLSMHSSVETTPTRVERMRQRLRKEPSMMFETATAAPQPLPVQSQVSITGRDDVIPEPTSKMYRPPRLAEEKPQLSHRHGKFLGGYETWKTYEPLVIENEMRTVRRQASEPLIRRVKSANWRSQRTEEESALGSMPEPTLSSGQGYRREIVSPLAPGFDMRESRLKSGKAVGLHYAGQSGSVLAHMSQQALSRNSTHGEKCAQREMPRKPTGLVADPNYGSVSSRRAAESRYYSEGQQTLSRARSDLSLRSAYTQNQFTPVRRPSPSQRTTHYANGHRLPGNMAYMHMRTISEDELPPMPTTRPSSINHHQQPTYHNGGRTYAPGLPMEHHYHHRQHPARYDDEHPPPPNALLQHLNSRRFPSPSSPQRRAGSLTLRSSGGGGGTYLRNSASTKDLQGYDVPPSRTNMSFMAQGYGVDYS